MTSPRDGSAQWRGAEDAAERVRVREAQHATLADLLAGYADGELPAESAAQVDAHLVGCARCRRDLAAQVTLRDRLAAEVVVPASSALRDRIVAATAAAPPPALFAASKELAHVAPAVGVRASWRTGRWWTRLAIGCALIFAVGGAVWWRGRPAPRDVAAAMQSTSAGQVPLLAATLADYRRSTAGDLPGRARDLDALRAAVGFPVEPLRAPELRLLAAWTTTLDGELAAVLAYRWRDHLVLQYRVSDALYFRYAALRSAATAHRPVTAVDGAQGVLAWPDATSGVILVSDDTPARLSAAVRGLPFAASSAGPRVAPDAGR